MKPRFGLYAAGALGLIFALGGCQQRQEEAPAAADAADVTVNPPPNVTVNPPDVNVKPPDIVVPTPPEGKVTRESTTVDVPGVGTTTTTTTTEKR